MNKEKYTVKFEKATAEGGHNDTILASKVLPVGLKAPFGDAWGYLEGKSMMEPHTHPSSEIYIVVSGKGWCHVDSDRFPAEPGDIINIPPNAKHTMECEDGETFLWAALWWDVM